MAKIGMRTNVKFLRLCRTIQRPAYQVRGLLELLWESAHENGPVFDTLDDIEVVSTWDGATEAFANALIDARLVDESEQGYVIHDYWEHCPQWVKDRESKRRMRAQAKIVQDNLRHGGDNLRHGGSSLAKPSLIKKEVCGETPGTAVSPPAELFENLEPYRPSPEKPYLITGGPYKVLDPDVWAWFPVKACKDDRGWPLFKEHVKVLMKGYSGRETDEVFSRKLLDQLQQARMWCISNPAQQKLPKGMPSFLNNWIGRWIKGGAR